MYNNINRSKQNTKIEVLKIMVMKYIGYELTKMGILTHDGHLDLSFNDFSYSYVEYSIILNITFQCIYKSVCCATNVI